jgi:pantothenate kinase type III
MQSLRYGVFQANSCKITYCKLFIYPTHASSCSAYFVSRLELEICSLKIHSSNVYVTSTQSSIQSGCFASDTLQVHSFLHG